MKKLKAIFKDDKVFMTTSSNLIKDTDCYLITPHGTKTALWFSYTNKTTNKQEIIGTPKELIKFILEKDKKETFVIDGISRAVAGRIQTHIINARNQKNSKREGINMELNKNIEFESNKINIIRLLNALKENKLLIERNNTVIFLSKKYLKHLSRNCSLATKKEGDRELILIGDKSSKADYNYSIVLEPYHLDTGTFYRIISVSTNDPEYDGVFVKPKEQTDLTSICFTKKAEKVLKK